jgi:hypothetical protein
MMYDWVKNIINIVEPLNDEIYGPLYRCSLTLNDGTFLPCAVIQSKQLRVDLAKRRIKEELQGRGRIGGEDPYGQIVSNFAASGNRVADYDVISATESKYAIPISLMRQIDGETAMAWTCWVFRMKDGRLFSYGTSFSMEFFQLPAGYEFSDVEEVINHSYIDPNGVLKEIEQSAWLPDDYNPGPMLRERPYFECLVYGI